MVLRVPQCLEDKSLLLDEPFKSCFDQRRPAKEGRNRKEERAPFYVELERRMREEPGGVSVVVINLRRRECH